MNKVQPKTLSGFMELLPNEQILFNQMQDKIRSTYEKFGFLPIDTPVIEVRSPVIKHGLYAGINEPIDEDIASKKFLNATSPNISLHFFIMIIKLSLIS